MGFHSKIKLGPLRDLVSGKGMSVRWERTAKCPCLNDNDQHSIRCSICRGHGYMVTESRLIKALVSGMDQKTNNAQSGQIDTGRMTLTPMPGTPPIIDGDRFVINEWTRRISEIVERTDDDRDPLRQLEPKQIVRVLRLVEDPVTGNKTIADLDSKGYSLDAGFIAWDPAYPSPDPGEKYTVNYEFKAVYQVYREEEPMYRQSDRSGLPQRVPIRYVDPHERKTP